MEFKILQKVTKTNRQDVNGSSGNALNNNLNKTSIQPKLTIGQPNDKYEQEADRVADQVIKSPVSTGEKSTSSAENSGISNIQRACTSCNDRELQKSSDNSPVFSGIQRESKEPVQTKFLQAQPEEEEEPVQAKILQAQPEEEEEPLQAKFLQAEPEEEEEPVQTKSIQKTTSSKTPTSKPWIETKINSSRNSGNSLPDDTRSFMENRFQTDFSRVKVHNDSSSVQMNKELNSQAFTAGSNIYFNRGKYDTGSSSGQHLLAHELTHVIQQGAANDKTKGN